MRVVFLGNHTVGVEALTAIAETEEVAGVVAHPPDPEDGVRYASVYDFARRREWPVVRGRGKDEAVAAFIRAAAPDLLWITDYRYLLPQPVLDLAPRGAVNLHPSLLPRYRGRAPINWAILHGEAELGLTAHFVEAEMDAGDVIVQERFRLSEDEDVGDALERLYPLYRDVTRTVLRHFREGDVPRRAQDHSLATAFPRRRPEDGEVDWHEPARRVRNLVRAVAMPYPGAFTFAEGCKLYLWKAALADEAGRAAEPGTVLAVDARGVRVQCGRGSLRITRHTWEDDAEPPRLEPGLVLGS